MLSWKVEQLKLVLSKRESFTSGFGKHKYI